MNKVFITGMGCITGLGKNCEKFWESLSNGADATRPLIMKESGVKIPIGVQILDYAPEKYFSSDKLFLLDRFSQLAIIAAQEAINDSGMQVNSVSIKEAACVIGTGCGGKQTDELTYQKLYKEKKARVHPLTIPKGMPSAAVSMVSSRMGIKGPTFSVTSACASGAHAIIQGALLIRSGIVDVVLAGGTDAPFTFGLLKSWEALRVTAVDACRPFSRDRSGIVLGEGAGIIVLESERHALNRGARCYSELVGYGMSSDAGHITRPNVDGIAAAIHTALECAGLLQSDVNYINAHGTGTVANDFAETSAIHKVFGEYARSIPVTSTKSMHGHALGASSAIELIATVYAINNGFVPPTINYLGQDEGCDLNYVPNYGCEMKIDVALSNSFAFGGLNAVIAVRKVD